ncbi:MAG TPA: TolC family protein [Gemmatimonadaceae bacterium]|nr:TolC family protein [Gemmatimonadaceae bacterium]
MKRALMIALGALGQLALPARSGAQTPARRDSVSYRDLLVTATAADPRNEQIGLYERATRSRLASIAAERLPALSIDGQAQYQSAVTTIAAPLPGVAFPTPARDTYDAHLGAEQSLLDPTRDARREIERARLVESRAQVRGSLFGIRLELADAFFAAASLQEWIAETDASIADVSARLRETVIRFREGAALRGDTASLAATLAERRQDRLALASDRSAALARVALLAGTQVADSATLVAPTTESLVREVVRSLDTLHTRPEYEQFAATRDRLARQSELASAQERPRISAFGRLGYGRPGLNLLSADFQTYWLAGLQLHWTPVRWGTISREREQLDLEREIVATNEAAFARSIARSVQPTLASIARLDSTLALDENVVALREQVVHEAQIHLREGVITAATYADRSAELLVARLRRVQHRVALEQARVTLLNTLGVEVR